MTDPVKSAYAALGMTDSDLARDRAKAFDALPSDVRALIAKRAGFEKSFWGRKAAEWPPAQREKLLSSIQALSVEIEAARSSLVRLSK